MTPWEYIILPSFEASREKYHIKQEKLDKFFDDLKKSPTTMKGAHALRATLKPSWSAHFDPPGGTEFIVFYFICNGDPALCFLMRGAEQHISGEDFRLAQHSCSSDGKKIYAWKFGTHKDYQLLQ